MQSAGLTNRKRIYPNTSDDPDRTDVLRNKFGIESNSELRTEEYRATAFRMAEIAEGDGPSGQFDKAHLKAIHGYIFQDVYEWAGHTRNESPIVDGQRVEPIGGLSKGGTAFLHGSRIEMGLDEALRPIRDPEVLRGSTPEQFAERAGQVMAKLNYVHPFREGNGRTQEVFIAELGRLRGHEVDFTVIAKPHDGGVDRNHERPVKCCHETCARGRGRPEPPRSPSRRIFRSRGARRDTV